MPTQSEHIKTTVEKFTKAVKDNPNAHHELAEKLKVLFDNNQLADEEKIKELIEGLEIPYES